MGRKATPEELAILEGGTPETEAPVTEAPDKAGTLESFGLGVARGTGRLGSGVERIGTFMGTDLFSEKARQERADIASKELAAEQEYASRTTEHPIASFLGEALPTTVLSGGRHPVGAALRGGLTGLSSYNPSPAGTALQAGLGAGLGSLGQRVAQGQRMAPQAGQMGLRVTPEQSSPTLFGPETVEGLSAFKKSALKTARFNQKQITRSAIRDDLGLDGDKFIFPSPKNKGTLQQVEEKAGKLFDEAVGSKENVLILNPRMRMIDDIASSAKVATDTRSIQVDLAKRIKGTIAKNRGVLPVSEYQKIRSDMTTSMLGLSKGGKKHAIGEMLDLLDDAAQGSLSTESLSTFKEARRLWKNKVKYETLVKRNGIDPKTGQIDMKKFDSVLNSKDAPAYIYNKNPSRTTQMMQVNKQITGAMDVKPSGAPRGSLSRVRFTQSGPGFILDRFLGGPLSSMALGANRLPAHMATDIAPGVTPPLMNMMFGDNP